MLVSVVRLSLLRLGDVSTRVLDVVVESLDATGCLRVDRHACWLDGLVDGQVDLLSRVEVERRVPGGRLLGVVVRDLEVRQMLVPVRVLEVDIRTQHLLECPVGPLSLSVSLRVVRCTHGQLGPELSPQCTPEVGSEARVAVAEDRLGHAVVSHDLV